MTIPSRQPLTPKQHKFYLILKDYWAKWGKSPSLPELRASLEASSLRSVSQYLKILERKGYIHRAKYQKRSIQLVGEGQSPTIQLPVLSAAGCDNASIIADRLYDEYIDVSSQMLNRKNPDKVVAIKAVGNSMVDAGIDNGDYVITEMTPEAEENDLVVAVVDGMAVIKKISFANNAAILNPVSSDKSYRPIIVQRNFQIFGKVINSIKIPKQIEFKYVDIIDS